MWLTTIGRHGLETIELEEMPDSPEMAKLIGVNHYVSNKPCRNGHVGRRDVKHRRCMECKKLAARERKYADTRKRFEEL